MFCFYFSTLDKIFTHSSFIIYLVESIADLISISILTNSFWMMLNKL